MSIGLYCHITWRSKTWAARLNHHIRLCLLFYFIFM